MCGNKYEQNEKTQTFELNVILQQLSYNFYVSTNKESHGISIYKVILKETKDIVSRPGVGNLFDMKCY